MQSISVIDPQNDQADQIRQAPNNIEAEQALLGAILVNNETYDRVSDFLKKEHFFDPVHQRIFEVSAELIKSGKIATPVTIKSHLQDVDNIGSLSPTQYVGRLAVEATSVINAADYGRVIYDLYIRRNLIGIGEDMVNLAFDSPLHFSPSDQIEDAEKRLFDIADKGKYGSGFIPFTDALAHSIEMASKAYERDGNLSGISSGMKTLDERLGGLQPSDLLVLAGRPSMGKTALVANIAYNVASAYEPEHSPDGEIKAKNGGRVAFFSLEMSSEQLATRIISSEAQIASEKIRRGQITEEEFARLVDVSQEIQSLPLFIDDTGGLNIAQVSARARRLKRQHGLDLLILDYLQLLAGSGKRSSDSRVQEITEITTGLKSLAKELDVPIIALSQLSRQVEAREDKRPQLSDLRESGSIEQDADVVMFVFREEYYIERTQPREGTAEFVEWQEKMEQVHGIGEVIIGKQRHGPTGTVALKFDNIFTRFSDLAKEEYYPEYHG